MSAPLESPADPVPVDRPHLHRLSLGYYGTCDRCGEAISAEHLEEAPSLMLCVPCLSPGTSR